MNDNRRRESPIFFGNHLNQSLERLVNSSTQSESRVVCCGFLTPVRRTFCLLVTFDLILTFLLWVIYTQVVGIKPFPKEAFRMEVGEYSFKTSMFDMIMASGSRFVILLLFYLAIRMKNPWIVGLTTAATTGSKQNVITYILLLESFVIAWIEVWFLDFNVLPREQKLRDRESLPHMADERSALLHRYLRATSNYDATSADFYSCREWYSPTGSDDEAEEADLDRTIVGQESQTEAKMIINKAKDAWDRCWAICKDSSTAWKTEGRNELATVHSIILPGLGKFFKLECLLEADVKLLFELLVVRLEETPGWNSQIIECRTLQSLTTNSDITYSIAAPGAGGVISSRDFVSARFWKWKEGCILAAATAVNCSKAPVNKLYVRGENNLVGWLLQPVTDERTKFVWLLNTDLKGYIPKFTVNKALCAVMLDFISMLIVKLNSLKNYE
ncbi:DgyrCDS10991 [Dimorphilus gyrociliatus]|uniref:DgyrCDS10991 n=1 Tax=Dimorphilus gyrociliatus TaxID=2664684 RepID=A0A7I8W209_9ANNE|nr:DgyrCDS10991 [Dimorphilus gyrociliatus]